MVFSVAVNKVTTSRIIANIRSELTLEEEVIYYNFFILIYIFMHLIYLNILDSIVSIICNHCTCSLLMQLRILISFVY